MKRGQTTLHDQQVMEVNLVSSVGDTERATEHTCTAGEMRIWNSIIRRSNPRTAYLKWGCPNATNFTFSMTEISQHMENQTPIFSDALCNYPQGRMVGIRIYPRGVASGRGTHVALFVHMIQGEYDNFLPWPFCGTITVSVLDQSGPGGRDEISRVIKAMPHLSAFQKPRNAISCTGYGFEKFAPIEKFFGPPVVKDDKMFLKIEFSGCA
ncbi:TNF receptor-associated factor 6-like isoform X3 [Montipora foliosa]|uniref:TNF receptor-associated factor 6-like isoform X2 n=1 Tax=Montipora foliosa TaxID=591990 RepID=UPI0035F1C2F5